MLSMAQQKATSVLKRDFQRERKENGESVCVFKGKREREKAFISFLMEVFSRLFLFSLECEWLIATLVFFLKKEKKNEEKFHFSLK